ncbi:hypothetical protein BU25DRAFT_22733 [Macroventuria anomochaeta]|uniref:Uncharacterized protein n=1 Tax=Macroventuria anomochaeta TaxID=301207 RepID=A0ACB6S7E1_9PLEO|nr:uncharacterized protein BU25DRAFT_22733 [Macroventuria anomochaeta]KAF2629485.1 hypothetical protein BU25DRAFT_22733 [Macroventuria anomochaeta]
MSTPSGISHPSQSQPYSQPSILHQNNNTFTAISPNNSSNDALFVSGGSSNDPSRSIFDSDEFDNVGAGDGEGDSWTEEEEEGLEEEQICELRDVNEEVDGVEFLARWRVFCGKDRVGAMENTEEDSRELDLQCLFVWVKEQIQEQSPIPYSVNSFTATVYFTGQTKDTRWVQTLREDRPESLRRLLHCLRQKLVEQRSLRSHKDLMVDFDLILRPSATTGMTPGGQGQGPGSSQRQTATNRQEQALGEGRAVLMGTEGVGFDIILHWKCTSLYCHNYNKTCWAPSGDAHRVEDHHKVPQPVAEIWAREVRQGMCTVNEPSENIRGLLVQEKARSRAPRNLTVDAIAVSRRCYE